MIDLTLPADSAVRPAVGQAMAVNIVKVFQDAVMTNTVARILHDAYAYCQVTFSLPPLGGSVPKRDASAVRSELATRKKVRKSATKNKNKKTSI